MPDVYPLTPEGVAAALAALGGTAAAVAARLVEGGHLGIPDECARCPVARYLRHLFPVGYFSVSEGGVVVTTADGWFVVGMPVPVADFIVRFDSGEYRELRDFPSAEPAGVS